MTPSPVTSCATCPLRKLEVFDTLSDDDLRFMERFKVGELNIDAGAPILMEGSNSPQLFTALEGMGLRYKLLPNGNRQVVNFVMPGDFIGLQAGVMGQVGHSVEATTPMVLCVFDRSELWSLYRKHPSRAYDLTWLAAIEEHFLGESLTSIGQRSAIERIAWGMMRFFLRSETLGLADGPRCPLPYRQQDIADALGLSLVHTNKTLKRLRDQKLMSWQDGVLHLMDREKLFDLAMYEDRKQPTRPLI